MNNPYGLSKYKKTSVTTASKGQIVVMLYESAIKYTKLALEGVQQKNLAKKGENILKAQDIINELSLSLNHDIGGSISKDLDRLYDFMIDQITAANIKNETKPLETIIKLLETLHEGWTGAVRQVAKFGGDPHAAAAAAAENMTGIHPFGGKKQ